MLSTKLIGQLGLVTLELGDVAPRRPLAPMNPEAPATSTFIDSLSLIGGCAPSEPHGPTQDSGGAQPGDHSALHYSSEDMDDYEQNHPRAP